MKNCYLACILFSAAVTGHPTQAQTKAQSPPSSGQEKTITVSSVCGSRATYDGLTNPWRHPGGSQKIPLGTAPVELTIESTEFDDRPVTAKNASFPGFCWDRSLSVGVIISKAGEGYSFANGEGSLRGGGGKIPAESFARLQTLMANLPDDHHRVPPPERMIVVAVEENGFSNVRLYDSADLPGRIVEMIRLTGARIKIVTPIFQPDKTSPPAKTGSLDLARGVATFQDRCGLFKNSDGSIGVAHDWAAKTLTVYNTSNWTACGPPEAAKIIRVIQEFWQPNGPGGYVVKGEFSPDGRFLLVSWGNRIGALLYDTGTWKPVTDPHLILQNLKEYLHSSDWSLGIAVTDAGEAVVWDARAHRVLSKLPGLGEFEAAPATLDQQGNRILTTPSAEILSAAFSPDRTRMAVLSGPNDVNKLHLSVSEIENGQKLRDFWPVEWMSYVSGQPLWWNHGRWLIAPYASQFSGSGLGLWNGDTGRFEGTLSLTGCDAKESPVVSGDRLLQPCFAGEDKDGPVLEWTVEGIQKQLEAFARQISAGGNPPE